MMKVLFLIHDLGQGGAEKVLVNLVNNMDHTKFEVHVTALFGGGVNEQFLSENVKYHVVWKNTFPANSKILKLFSPEQLHRICVREHYDAEVAYLEGPSARIISGCTDKNTRLVSWIHVEQHTKKNISCSFRSFSEAQKCYRRFGKIICVSEFVKQDFESLVALKSPCEVLYNTVESEKIVARAKEPVDEFADDDSLKLIAVGTLKKSKGYLRLLKIIKKLKSEQFDIHLYILGSGPQEQELKRYIVENNLNDVVTLLGYNTNPYKYVANADIFVCASFAEGFSTATTEALILGTPVCTVNVSGMQELLGAKNEYGVITDNSEEALYQGLRKLIVDEKLLSYYKQQACLRGKLFDTRSTVKKVEQMLTQQIKN